MGWGGWERKPEIRGRWKKGRPGDGGGVPGAGCLMLGAGDWVPGAGGPVVGAWCWVLCIHDTG